MNWDQVAEEYLAVAREVFNDLREPLDEIAAKIADRLQSGGKILVCGNGGSAADAQHFAGEMVNRFLRERAPYAAIALSTDTSVLTAIGNDYGFGEVFEKQVLALGGEQDVLIAISTSGRSENVCRAVKAAKGKGLWTVALTGGDGAELGGLVDDVLAVEASTCCPRIQEGHQLIIHALCERIEEIIG